MMSNKKEKKSSLIKNVIKLIGSIGINVLCAYFFPIHAEHCYGWTGGFWHGSTLIGNWILSLFDHGRLLMAPCHTGAYKVWFWIPLVPIVFWSAILISFILALIVMAIVKRRKS